MSTQVDLNAFISDKIARISYSQITIRIALDNRNGNPNTFCFGRVDFVDADIEAPDVTYDYGNFRLLQRSFPITHVTQILSEIAAGALTIDGNQISLNKTGGKESYRFIPSESSWHVIDADGPQHCISVGAERNLQIPFDPLESRPGTPHYRTKIQAVMDFMHLRQLSQFNSELLVVLHELRGRIKQLEVVGKELIVEVEGKEKDDHLYVQFYCKKGEKSGEPTLDISVKARKATHTASFEPDQVDAILVLRNTNEILDQKELGGWIHGQGGIVVRTPESTIKSMIALGESKTVEFKTGLGDEVFRTIVSFSNTEGGTIIVGVTDNKQVLGFESDQLRSEKSIMSRARSQCIPSVEPKLEWTEIDGRPLLIIKVAEGIDKPYTLRGSGGFIRDGEGDYPIERPELDKIYAAKNQGNKLPGSF